LSARDSGMAPAYPQSVNIAGRKTAADKLFPSDSESIHQPTLLRPRQDSNQNQRIIRVPASLVPDQSVSPRTKMVQILKLPNTNQISSPQAVQHAIRTSPSSQYLPTINLDTQGQLPRGPYSHVETPHNATSPTVSDLGLIRVQQQSRSHSSDLLRKPSLYKVPPWPSPTSLPSTVQAPSSTLPPYPSNRRGGELGISPRPPTNGTQAPMIDKSHTPISILKSPSSVPTNSSQGPGTMVSAMTTLPRGQPTPLKHPPNL
jgi:hypothetical protein